MWEEQKMAHEVQLCVPVNGCSYHIFACSAICFCTDLGQHEIHCSK